MAGKWKLKGDRANWQLRELSDIDKMIEAETKDLAQRAAMIAGSTGSAKYPRWFVGEWTAAREAQVMGPPKYAGYDLRPIAGQLTA